MNIKQQDSRIRILSCLSLNRSHRYKKSLGLKNLNLFLFQFLEEIEFYSSSMGISLLGSSM